MVELLTWIYILNSTILLVHEIDSAYWKEWELFHLPGGEQGFLLMHIPLVVMIMYGLILLQEKAFYGYIASLVVSLTGFVAFTLHTYFIRKGNEQFTTPISLGLLRTTLVLSIFQAFLTLQKM